ncbi:MAG: cation diffusion facilitator family transporter [Clostridia bacterium]|nr:cation diffusion facilitator family transporter [Clostridia bacterium]MDD4145670.1 cation diffusion facilitator family transporter [Clostridia bacterium]MDD4665156.1 cation diffusion facilitator family transporter [Clostridia bacterium]
MPDFLVKKLIKNYQDLRNTKVREQYGKMSSIVGILVNVFLFMIKFTVGTLFHSVAVVADAVNNLSDAGSSVISLVSFKLSSKPADEKHPFGHERIEYIASSLVAVFILLLGVELLKTSFNKIFHPDKIEFSLVVVGVLLFSIAAKLWLYRFNIALGKLIDSSMLKATAVDSFSDVLATSSVLLATIFSPLLGFQLDGYVGIIVSVLIMISGINILKETLDSLLGQVPSGELVELIDSYVRKHDGVLGIHDLVVHNYGPRRYFASVHIEVDAKENILVSHDLIDNIERDIAQDLGIHLVIHLDPIITDDPFVNELRELTAEVVSGVDDSLSMHDFRVVKGVTHSNLIFDVVIPHQCKKSDSEVTTEITQKIKEKDKSLYTVITIDRFYI